MEFSKIFPAKWAVETAVTWAQNPFGLILRAYFFSNSEFVLCRKQKRLPSGSWGGVAFAGIGSVKFLIALLVEKNQCKAGGDKVGDGLGYQNSHVTCREVGNHQNHQEDNPLTADGKNERPKDFSHGLEHNGDQQDDSHKYVGNDLPAEHEGPVADNAFVVHKAAHKKGSGQEYDRS